MNISNINKILIVIFLALVLVLCVQNWPEHKPHIHPYLAGDPTEQSLPIDYSDSGGSIISGHIYVVDKGDFYLLQMVIDYFINESFTDLCVNTPSDYQIAMFCGHNDNGLSNNPEVIENSGDRSYACIIKNAECAESGNFNIEYHFDKNESISKVLSIEYNDQYASSHVVSIQLTL